MRRGWLCGVVLVLMGLALGFGFGNTIHPADGMRAERNSALMSRSPGEFARYEQAYRDAAVFAAGRKLARAGQTQILSAIVASGTLVAGILGAWLIRRSTGRSTTALTTATHDIVDGEFAPSAEPTASIAADGAISVREPGQSVGLFVSAINATAALAQTRADAPGLRTQMSHLAGSASAVDGEAQVLRGLVDAFLLGRGAAPAPLRLLQSAPEVGLEPTTR